MSQIFFLYIHSHCFSFLSQEKYLSEHNYEEPIDEERAIRLLNFGDDYRNYIDSLSDGFSSVNEHNRLRLRNKRRSYKKYKVRKIGKK